MSTKDFFDQQIQEIRLRREAEEKLVRLWLAICAGTLSGAFAFVQWNKDIQYLTLIFLIFVAAMLAGVGERIARKIESEHEVYRAIGRSIVALLPTDFSLGEVGAIKPNIGSDIKKLGSGNGYQLTSDLVRFSAGTVAIALIVLGVVPLLVAASKHGHPQ